MGWPREWTGLSAQQWPGSWLVVQQLTSGRFRLLKVGLPEQRYRGSNRYIVREWDTWIYL